MATGEGTGTPVSGSSEPITRTEAKAHLRIDHTDDDTYIDSLITMARKDAEQFLHRKLIQATLTGYLNKWPDGDSIVMPFGNLQSVTSVKYKDTDGAQTTFGTALPTITGITKANPGVVSSVAHGLSVYDMVHFTSLTEMTELNDTTQMVTVIDSADTFSINDCSGYSAAETTGGVCGTSVDYIAAIETEPGQIILGYGEVWPSVVLYPSNPIEIIFIAGYGADAADVPEPIRHAIKLILADKYETREDVLIGAISSNLKAAINLMTKYKFYTESEVRVI